MCSSYPKQRNKNNVALFDPILMALSKRYKISGKEQIEMIFKENSIYFFLQEFAQNKFYGYKEMKWNIHFFNEIKVEYSIVLKF